MTQYTKGQRYQYKARDELIEDGFQVMVSARSLGMFDMIAWDFYSVRWIQIKSYSKKRFHDLSPAELKEIEEIPIPCGYDKEIWIWFKRKGWRKWTFQPASRTLPKGWLLVAGRDTVEKKLLPLDHPYPKPF